MPRRTKAEIEAAARRSETAWKYRLKKEYGLTPEEYWAIYAAQGGHCYMCPNNGRTVRLGVDHDHNTGFIRGLLCRPCNTYLGRQAHDNPEVYRRGWEYLMRPPAFDVIGQRAVPSQVAACDYKDGGTIDTRSHPTDHGLERPQGDRGSGGTRLAA